MMPATSTLRRQKMCSPQRWILRAVMLARIITVQVTLTPWVIMLTVCYEGTMRIDVAAFVLKVNLAC